MSPDERPQTTEVPGMTVRLKPMMLERKPDHPTTLCSALAPFEAAKPFLSDKPLRRPVRTMPLPR